MGYKDSEVGAHTRGPCWIYFGLWSTTQKPESLSHASETQSPHSSSRAIARGPTPDLWGVLDLQSAQNNCPHTFIWYKGHYLGHFGGPGGPVFQLRACDRVRSRCREESMPRPQSLCQLQPRWATREMPQPAVCGASIQLLSARLVSLIATACLLFSSPNLSALVSANSRCQPSAPSSRRCRNSYPEALRTHIKKNWAQRPCCIRYRDLWPV